jgi:HEAT repeat protein
MRSRSGRAAGVHGDVASLEEIHRLLLFLVAKDAAIEETAAAISTRLRDAGPATLAWIDEEIRRHAYHIDGGFYASTDGRSFMAWRNFVPEALSGLARRLIPYPAALGLFASHPNGHVREAAVQALAAVTDGRELPFLALRANDWVPEVAARAEALLVQRLRPDNRRAVLVALPFLVRLLGQRRRDDHRRILAALRHVVVSAGARPVLERIEAYDTGVRRFVYDLLNRDIEGDSATTAAVAGDILRAALADRDAVVRQRVVRRLSCGGDVEASVEILTRLLRDDPAPGVRKEALAALAARETVRDRLHAPLLHALLDRAARVRELARFIVRDQRLPIVPRDVYVAHITNVRAGQRTSVWQLTSVINGLGETGTSVDVDLLEPFLHAALPGLRRAAVRASAALDLARGLTLAIAALHDVAGSVRSAAMRLLRQNAQRVAFASVHEQLRGLNDPRDRERLLPLFAEAPKWEALAFLLEALDDEAPTVRTKAVRLVESWIATFNKRQTRPSPQQLARIRALLTAKASTVPARLADLLRFSLKTY